MAKYDLNNKVVLITGATGGIGAATARELANKGANLVLVDLDEEKLKTLAAEFQQGQALVAPGDVTDAARMKEIVDEAVATYGKLDVALANAGIAGNPPSTSLTASREEVEKVMEVNIMGVWRTVHPCLEEIVKNNGYVMITASVYSFFNGVANLPYATSKAAVEMMSRSLRAELAGSGAKAGALYPGWVKTPIIEQAFGGNEIATKMIKGALPAFMRTPIPAERLAKAAVKGMEKRATRTIEPKFWAMFSAFRGLFQNGTDLLLDVHKKNHRQLRKLDDWNRERLAKQNS